MEDLFRTLPKILTEFEDSDAVREAVVFATWKKAAGKSLCDHAVAVSLTDKRLVVAVKDEMWKSHLESLVEQMIFKINSILSQPSITFIEFSVDQEFVALKTGNNRQTEISDAELRKRALEEISTKLSNSAETIADEKLRAQFLLAAGSCLARKKRMGKGK